MVSQSGKGAKERRTAGRWGMGQQVKRFSPELDIPGFGESERPVGFAVMRVPVDQADAEQFVAHGLVVGLNVSS